MTKELERDLGLVSVVAISMGAMIGSGIFILPGIAMAEAGPAVILAFVLAAILVLPAGLSIAELGTAMPEAGGDYIYIERSVGPAMGTIAGLGTWLMLMLKGALALFGGMFYLDAVVALPSETAAALTIGLVLIAVNVVGVKQTGQLQVVLVAVMLFILAAFVALTIPNVESGNYDGFFDEGSGGLFAATATVLVSYAGVTKIAAVAEEIEQPERNLPLGLVVSLVVTAFLYALIVFVLVGLVDAPDLRGTEIPMVEAVDPFFGFVGVVAIVVAAMFALISTANAGILTASRYPLALSRDDLFFPSFSRVHDRLGTPVVSILVTGGAMLAFIVVLDIDQIAKSAGSFQIIVYILVNVALIAFRERDLEWYDPGFESPAYPWLQLFGIVSGGFIITQMDLLPQVGGLALLVGGVLFYYIYARDRVDRQGIAIDVARRSAGRRALAETETALRDENVEEVVVALQTDIDETRERVLLRLVAPLVRERGRISVVKFSEVPDQVPLETATGQTVDDVAFEEYTHDLAAELDVEVSVSEVVSHDTKHAIVNVTRRTDADLLVAERESQGRIDTLLGRDADWIMSAVDCDTVFVQNRGLDDIDEILVVTDRTPFNDPMKIRLADALATEHDARVRCLFAADADVSDAFVETIRDYHAELDDRCAVAIESEIVRTEKAVETVVQRAGTADLVMLGTDVHRRLLDALFPQFTDQVTARLDQTTLHVHSKFARRHTFLRPIVSTLLFRSGKPPQPEEDAEAVGDDGHENGDIAGADEDRHG